MKSSNVKNVFLSNILISKSLTDRIGLLVFYRTYYTSYKTRNELKLFEVFRGISLIARTGDSFMQINTTITRRGEGGDEGDRNRKGEEIEIERGRSHKVG